MLKWSTRAQKAVSVFFVKWNDIDVFVEDTAMHAKSVYVSLIGRALGGNSKVSEVFPLGDRQRVIDACQADTKTTGRNRIYLIDGDLNLVSGTDVPSHKRLYMHKVYHVENYFICEFAMVTILQEENPRFTLNEISEKLAFNDWVSQIAPLRNLFLTFGISRLIDPSLPTIKLGVDLFTDAKKKLDGQKIVEFCTERLEHLRARSTQQSIDVATQSVTVSIERHQTYLDTISAREYLFPLLRRWIGSKHLKIPSGNSSLFYRLSKVCLLDRHIDLVQAVKMASH